MKNENCSTTRLLVQNKPIFEQKPKYKLTPRLFLPPNIERKGEGGLRTKGFFKQSYEGKPLISVVTVVYNGEKYLEQTILSVLEQDYDNVEYIIVDGGSTDGTLDIVKKYENAIDYWISEPDKGISDAFNKGIKLTIGECIGIINADDWYESDCISTIVMNLQNGGILYGRINYWTDAKIDFTSTPDHSKIEEEMSISHPAVFIKRSVYEHIGLFQTSYQLAMDYELILRAYRQNTTFHYINRIISNMRNDGISAQHWIRASKEVKRAKISLGSSRISAELNFLSHTLWPYVKVSIFKSINNSPFRYILIPYRILKKLLVPSKGNQ